jgi:hypothetical protein
MHWIYRTLLRLYPTEHRLEFGGEMLAVFTRIAGERRAQGRAGYWSFLAAEFLGLLGGACGEWFRRISFAPAIAAIALTALLHGAFYAATSVLLRRVAAAAERSTVAVADPRVAGLAVGLLGVLILLCLMPLFFLLSMRLMYRRR